MSSTAGSNYSCEGYKSDTANYHGTMAQHTGNAYTNPTTGVSNTNAADSGQQALHDENKQK